MVKLTKIYTKRGDGGETDLAGGHRIAKNAVRIILIGEVDELNTCIALAAESIRVSFDNNNLYKQCQRLQNELFNLGSQLAVLLADRREHTPALQTQDITRLESEIDEVNASLPSLNSFLLPGGSEPAARLHHARAVCRRVERAAIDLKNQDDEFEAIILHYLNRLSDWLFVMARHCNAVLKQPEVLWKP